MQQLKLALEFQIICLERSEMSLYVQIFQDFE